MAQAEQVTEVVTEHGEGSVWAGDRGSLLFVDLIEGDLMELDATGAVQRRHVDRVLTAMRPRRAGGWVVAVERGFRFLTPDLEPDPDRAPVTAFTDDRIRMNDGGCDPQGRFYCGTMAYDETPGAATVYRLDPDGTVGTALTGVTISNGIQWPGDGTVLYADSPTRRVDRYVFDAAAGSLSDPRPFAPLPDGAGVPDGTALDEEGGLWVACWGGWGVRRFGPDGTLTETVEVAAPNVSSCTFGGADGRTLWITTSRTGGGDAVAASGAVFAAEVGVRGAPIASFAG